MGDVWEYHIQLRKGKWFGHRWAVVAYLNGRADPGVPENGGRWALTLRAACRRAGRVAADRAIANGADPDTAEFLA